MHNIKSRHHELLKAAIEATDSYLGIEKQAVSQGFSNPAMNTEFLSHIKSAYDALNELGVFDQHEEYMKTHIQKMIDLTPVTKGKQATFDILTFDKQTHEVEEQKNSNVLTFKQFIKEEKKDAISKEEIDDMVDRLEWEDIVDLYSDEELFDDEEDEDDKKLDEKISAQSRISRKQAFARSRGKRNLARNIKLHRASGMDILKKRAIVAARRAIYQRFLRGRDKSTLSAAEKDRIEQQVSRMKNIQSAIALKMLPKIRSIEQTRLANYRKPAKR